MTINVESTETLYATQEKTFFLKRGEAMRLTPTGSVRVNRYNLGTLLDTTTVTSETTFGAYFADMSFRIYCSSGALTIEMGDDSGEPRATAVFPYYHFHGFAGGQVAGDGKFFDLSGINHGFRTPGGHLSDAQMFANFGYVSTVDPAAGAEDSTIHIPAVNFDYAGGEKLIVWWLGSATPEAAAAVIMGDGYHTDVNKRGWRVRMLTDGKFDLALYGGTSGFSGSSHAVVFDGSLHSLAFTFDGTTKTHGLWSDEAFHPALGSIYGTFGGGVAFDTKSTNTVNIGSSRPASAASGAVGDGAALKTRALVIIRLPSTYTMPTAGKLTEIFQQLRVNPGKLILATAF